MNLDLDTQVSLEPRLVEYLNKRDYYKKNNIDTANLEMEYGITKRDISRIKAYFRGDQKTYDKSCYRDMVDTSRSSFPSEKFPKDPRFDRLKKKQEREKEAQEQRKNYGIVSRGYDMYRNDRQFASAYGDDFESKFDPKTWLQEDNKNVAKPRYSKNSMANTNTYNVNKPIVENKFTQPRSKYNGYVPYEGEIKDDPHSLDNIIDELNHVNMPLKNGKPSDMDADNYCRFGQTPSRSGKSLGYPNPVEHYFNYVSDDMQRPEHVVSNRPQDTRHLNKKEARPMFDGNNRKPMH